MKYKNIKLCDKCDSNHAESDSAQLDNTLLSPSVFDFNEYQEIFEQENRIIHINYEINASIYDLVTRKIQMYNLEDELAGIDIKDRSPIKIHIHSVGGSLQDGLTVINAIVSSKTPVHTYAESTVASMAFMIYVAGHYRYARRFNDFMYHDISFDIGGTTTDVKRATDHITNLRNVCDDFIIERTNITISQLNKVLECNKDWHFFSDEAKELGVCHEII